MDVRRTKKHDNMFFVTSETGEGEYQVVCASGQWLCTCKAFLKKKLPCKHIHQVLEYLKDTEGGREDDHIVHMDEMVGEEGGMMVPPPPEIQQKPSNGIASHWVKQIHRRNFIQYEGLLAMAHERGLTELSAEFISVTDTLALAAAHAFFKDGRKFWDAGDATPTNVHVQVKAHFPRIALTRAKARVLRDALNIGMIAVEELENEG